ncbi:MAG TPA: metalloregulator ArsR/SmtB family transcription factor [Rhodopila sp.]
MTPADPLGCDPQATAEFLRALAHPTRLQILCRLLDGEAAVAAFESELGLKQPNLSQQLGLLRDAGLVATRREAKSIFYSLADDRVRPVLDTLRDTFSATAAPADRVPRPKAGQRPAVLASATTPAPRPKAPPAAMPGGECGVFSMAGWDIRPGNRKG